MRCLPGCPGPPSGRRTRPARSRSPRRSSAMTASNRPARPRRTSSVVAATPAVRWRRCSRRRPMPTDPASGTRTRGLAVVPAVLDPAVLMDEGLAALAAGDPSRAAALLGLAVRIGSSPRPGHPRRHDRRDPARHPAGSRRCLPRRRSRDGSRRGVRGLGRRAARPFGPGRPGRHGRPARLGGGCRATIRPHR